VGGVTHFQEVLQFQTKGVEFRDISADIDKLLGAHRVRMGLVTVFVRHTSASLTIQENADPSVLVDLIHTLQSLAPEGANYLHDSEGPDDMPAHIKSMLTATSLSIPVREGQMVLGTWQGVYLIEHRRAPHLREVVVHYVGEAWAFG